MLSILALGWGSLFAVMLMRRYGRLPVLFWSQVHRQTSELAYDRSVRSRSLVWAST